VKAARDPQSYDRQSVRHLAVGRLPRNPEGSHCGRLFAEQVCLRCTDGAALLAYTGVGTLRVGKEPETVRVSDWIRQILRGESRTVDQSLIYLRERATADLGPACEKDGIRHVFTVGAFLQGRPWAVQIRNFRFSPGVLGPPARGFVTVAEQVADGGRFVALGTPDVVPPADLRTLHRLANIKPRQPKEFRKLLAAVNRRAAATKPDGGYVSPHCTTAYLPPTGEPFERELHDVQGAPSPVVIPFLLFGIDTTESHEVMARSARAARDGGSIPSEELDYDRAGRESVTARNPLRPPRP